MAVFEYQALDGKGKEKKGIYQADTTRALRQWLRDQGLIPLEVREIAESMQKSSANRLSGKNRIRIKHDEIVLLTRQLATLLSSGMPVEEALQGVSEQSEHHRVKRVITAVRAKVMEGHSLAQALADFPGVFSGLYHALVSAGESSGHLDTVLNSLAEYTENQQVIRQKISQAAIYPTVMIMVSVAIVMFLMWYVFPQLVGVFESGEQALPLITQILLVISDGIQHYGLAFFIGLCVFIIGFKQSLKFPSVRKRFHAFVLRLPIIGPAIRVVETARFARTLGILSKAGVPILEAMQAASNVVTSIPIKMQTEQAIIKVKEGVSIHRALAQTRYFPPMSIHLIASGEASGQLEAMLAKAADSQDRAVEALMNKALALFEPLMIVVMGGIVLFIVLGALLPIFDLTQMAL